MAKILIFGNSGAGKSTFGRKLSSVLKTDILYLDKFAYEKSWDNPNYQAMEEKVQEFLKKENYIIDGNFLDYVSDRIKDCDTIYFLDIDRFTCLSNVLKRKKEYQGKTRESRNDNCDEKISKDYLKWVFFDFYKTNRKKIINIISNNKDKKIIVFKNKKQIEKYLDNLLIQK